MPCPAGRELRAQFVCAIGAPSAGAALLAALKAAELDGALVRPRRPGACEAIAAMKIYLLAVLCPCIAIACDGIDAADQDSPAGDADEIDLDGVIDRPEVQSLFERTRRAFTAHGEMLHGGDAVAGTQVSSAGIAVTPYQWPDETRSIEGAALRLRTASIAVGGIELAGTAPPEVRLASDGGAAIEHAGAVEQVRNTAGGFEQSWDFAAPPEADGDLIVRVAVDGQAYAGRTDAGLHFADPATGLGFSYSDGVWIDATGERTPVAAAYDGGAIVLTVPHDVVQGSAYPARLDPTVSAEHGLDNPILGPAALEQSRPDIAYSGVTGAEFLIVWSDSRRTAPLFFTNDVFGARVNAAGQVLDPTGIHIPFDKRRRLPWLAEGGLGRRWAGRAARSLVRRVDRRVHQQRSHSRHQARRDRQVAWPRLRCLPA